MLKNTAEEKRLNECVSIKTLSSLLEIPERTIRTWVYKRKIPYYKIGKLVRFDIRQVRDWYGRSAVTPLFPDQIR